MEEKVLEKVREYGQVFGENDISEVLSFVSKKCENACDDLRDPCETMEILLPLNPDKDTICAVFLIDLYIEGEVSDFEVRDRFGESVHDILSALVKLDSLGVVEHDKSFQAEVLRRMFLTMAKDLRVVIILLARKVVQMNNLEEEEDEEKRLVFAKRAMIIYAQIASRLGIYSIRTLLEDGAFRYISPQAYEDIEGQIKKLGGAHEASIKRMVLELKEFLKVNGIEARVEGRTKSIYGIYRKLVKKNLTSVEDIYDFFAIRIILPDSPEGLVDNLYAVLGLIHSHWKPLSHKFKDYIAVPKPNGYKSLHTVICGLGEEYFGKPVEIQIRDEKMHRESECGMASHWVYKTDSFSGSSVNIDSHSEWIKGLTKIHEFFRMGMGDIKEVDIDVFKDNIFVLTPMGEVKDLPVGSVPIDFAYAIHTDVGNKCAMAKVNGVVAPLDYKLKNGDVVEIITRRNIEPKAKWLSVVKTPLARSRIKSWFGS